MTFLEFLNHVLDSHWTIIVMVGGAIATVVGGYIKLKQYLDKRGDLRTKEQIEDERTVQDGYNKLVDDQEKRIASLANRVTVVEEEYDRARARWVTERTDLEKQISVLRERIRILEEQLSAAYSDRTTLLRQIDDLKSQIADLERKLGNSHNS